MEYIQRGGNPLNIKVKDANNGTQWVVVDMQVNEDDEKEIQLKK